MPFRFIFFLLFITPVFAWATDVKVYERVLANGLKILVKEDHRSPVVVSQIWYKVGSSYEYDGITGISHMLEHMMFKGTEAHPAGEFSRIIAEHGGRENAFTGRDYTAYFQTLEKSRLPISFELEADRMRHLKLSGEELKKELQVVMEERRMRTDDKPRAKTEEYFMATAYTSSPYRHPVIGWPADIEQYTVDDLRRWYQKWYAPNNATLVVVGDVQAEAVFALAQRYFGPLATRPVKALKRQPDRPQSGIRRIEVKLPAKLPWLVMGYKVPVLHTVGQEWEVYALEVLAAVLDGGSSARLSSRLVRGRQIAVSAGAGYNLAARLSGLFTLEATPAQGQSLWDMESALRNEILDLQRNLVDRQELQRIKAQVLAGNVYERDSNFYQAMQLGLLETVGVGWQKSDEYLQKINQVTAEQVREVARKYLVEDQLTIAFLQPQEIRRFGSIQQSKPISQGDRSAH